MGFSLGVELIYFVDGEICLDGFIRGDENQPYLYCDDHDGRFIFSFFAFMVASAMATSKRENMMKRKSHPHLFFVFIGLTPGLFIFIGWSFLQAGLVSVGLMLILEIGLWVYQDHQQDQRLRTSQKKMIDAYRLIKVMLMQSVSPYQALQTVLPFVDAELAEHLHDLLMAIDQDKSIHPYLHFASRFRSLMIEQLFFALYQLENQGGHGQQLQQFQYLFDQAEHQYYQSKLNQFHEGMQNANGYVMVATGMIAFSLLIGVMQLIAGMMYGL
jgi:hypothetical protein